MRRLAPLFASIMLLSTLAAAHQTSKNPTVYVLDSGKSYHVKNCRLKKGSHAMPLSDAKKKGYKPCKVCNPPK